MLTADQLKNFLKLYQYVLPVLRVFKGQIGRPERRVEQLAKFHLALEALEAVISSGLTWSEEDEPDVDLPIHIMTLRNFVTYIDFEVDRKWFRKHYGPTSSVDTHLVLCSSILKSIGLRVTVQPDWREESYKLYWSLCSQGEGKPPGTLNEEARKYLETRFSDEA